MDTEIFTYLAPNDFSSDSFDHLAKRFIFELLNLSEELFFALKELIIEFLFELSHVRTDDLFIELSLNLQSFVL